MRKISISLISSAKEERERVVSFFVGEVLREKVADSPIRHEFPDTGVGKVAMRKTVVSMIDLFVGQYLARLIVDFARGLDLIDEKRQRRE